MSVRRYVEIHVREGFRPALKHIIFACFCLVCLFLDHHSLYVWAGLSRTSEESSNLWLIPVISAFLLYEHRRAIFANTRFTPMALPWFLAGILIQAFSLRYRAELGSVDCTILVLVGLWVTITGLFVICYGTAAWKAARFPLGFLLFAIPLPLLLLESVVRYLQHGSAAVVEGLFLLLRVPFVREGVTFHLSGLSIEIAPECSGIRSSYALLVLSVLLSYLLLHKNWRRILVVAAVLPLALLKNGIRIVTLCLLTMHVDPSILSGPLHHQGGFVFFGVGLLLEGMFCWFLQRQESSNYKHL